MQNDRSTLTAGKDIKTLKLEMRQQKRKEAQVRLEQAKEMRKN